MASFLHDLGHTVYLYGGERTDARCTENVCVVTAQQREEWFGHYNWVNDVFNGWDPDSEWWRRMNIAASAEILKRSKPTDYVGIIAGRCQMMLSDLGITPIEWGIGYSGVLKNTHKCFESYAWMHHVMGRENDDDIKFFDTVIPNSFEIEDFPLGQGAGGYGFFGRLIRRKGPHIAGEACKRLGVKLTLAGQGLASQKRGIVVGMDGVEVKGNVKHIGRLNPGQRANFLGSLKALFVPTVYLEPFGGVAVESLLCGTPVICTDHGAFTEYIENGVNGFRCRTLSDFIRAAELAPTLDRNKVRKSAHRFTTKNVAPLYDEWLRRLDSLSGEGWYAST